MSDLTAHEILATHTTNVAKVTAKVIERACADHANLQLACKELTARVAALEALAGAPAPDESDPMACAFSAFADLSMAAARAAKAFSRLRYPPPVPVLGATPPPPEEVMTGAEAYALRAQHEAREDVVADLKAALGGGGGGAPSETNGTANQ